MKFGIRLKLILFTASIVLLVGGSIFFYSIYQGRQQVLSTFEKDARGTTAAISEAIVNDLYFLDLRSLRHRLGSARVNPDIRYTYVTDLEGLVLSDGTGENPLKDQRLIDGFSQEIVLSKDWISRVEGDLLKVGGPVFLPDGTPLGHLHVGFSLGYAYQAVRDTTRTSLHITLICLGIGGFLAFIVAQSFSRPISSLVRASREIGEGRLDTRLTVKRSDELGTLAESINQMAETLQMRQAETKRAEEKLQDRYKELETLHEMGQTILSSPDLKTILERILGQALSIGGFDIGNIRLLDPSTQTLDVAACRGYQDPENVKRHHWYPTEATTGRLTSKVLTYKQPHVEENVQECDGLRTFKREGVHSAIVVPVRAQDQILGAIQLGSRTPRKFQPDEVRLLGAIGDQMGIAVQKARLYEQTQRNLGHIRALREIDHAITSTLELRGVLAVLLEKIDLVLPYAATTIRLWNKENGLLEPVACRNLDEKEWKAEQWKAGRGIPNVVFETKAPVRISNVQTDPRTKDLEFFRKHELVSYLGVPLLAQDEILGVISFYTKEEHEFSDNEVEFLTTLAGQAAIAIHNSQLYEEMANLAGELAKSNRVKDEFLSVMSHELRTPLNVVMGYTWMIKDGLLGEVNPEQEKALEKVMSRAKDQLTLINSVLQVTQIEAEGVKVELHEVALGAFLDELKSNYEVPLGKELALKWDYPSELPVVRTDSEKLKHILGNLTNNAIKFTDKGHVAISARYVPGKKAVEFKVADTGIGIPEESLPVIFEKFRQVDSSETRQYGGVGIGLCIVKKFTELLGGKVEVESQVGKGSTFTVTIPLT